VSGWAVPDFIAHHAVARPSRLACVDLASGRRWTYVELNESIARCVAVLLSRGIGAGDCVALLARNSAWQLILQQALVRIGAVFAPLNWRLAQAEIDTQLADCAPALFIDHAGLAALGEAVDAAAPATLAWRPDAESPSMLLFTSGTSGRAKGVVITERNAFFTGVNFSLLGQVDGASTFLCDAPMFHVIGLLTSLRPALMQGGTVLVSPGFEPALTNARLGDPALGVTHYFCVPQMAKMLREAPGFDPARLSGLRALFTGGAPNPAADVLAWLDEGVMMVDGYGMTEAGTVLGMPLHPELIRAKAGAAGLPPPTLALRLRRADGGEALPGEVGELEIKGPNVTPGYWRQPDETAQAFTGDGWFRTGDLGQRDADGFVSLVERKKDMFISGGENVYPAEIEQVLLRHPGVAAAAVIGVPDPKWGEVGRAFVVLGEPCPEAVLAAHCEAHLARYKVPKRILSVKSLPLTGSGKVMKQVLREKAWLDTARQIS
jgi:fatty-acyl-CoA synthase